MKETLIEKLKRLLAELLQQQRDMKRLQPLVERKANEVLREMALLGLPMRIVEGYRSVERQNELYAQGRTKPGAIVTNAKGGQSLHNYGVAIDCCFVKTGYNAPESHWITYGTVAKKHGFEYGGDWVEFKDRPHIQMTLGHPLVAFQKGTVDYSQYK